MKKRLYIDMDGVIVNLFDEMQKWFKEHEHISHRFKEYPDHIHGIFRYPEPVNGAISAINKLNESGKYEMFILTAAPWGNPDAASDKRYWVEKYFGNLFHKKMIITHRKDLLIGDYLIDDSKHNGAGDFTGELLDFGIDYKTGIPNKFKNWNEILEYLL